MVNVTKINFFGKDFLVYHRNGDELKRVISEVFESGEYRFVAQSKSPLIIDCGSHIGISVLYFKSIYPDSRIIAFEPNPENYELLVKNISANGIKGVKIYNLALYSNNGFANLSSDENGFCPWTWGDNIFGVKNSEVKKIRFFKVKTAKLSEIIKAKKKVDFLKIDIEGSELEVIKEIKYHLGKVKKLVVEFHGSHEGGELSELLNIFKVYNFKYVIRMKMGMVLIPNFLIRFIPKSWYLIVMAIRMNTNN